MANINALLPTAVAIPFHPATEALQHENAIRPIIPKTEIISSYTKLRDEQEKAQLTPSKHTILQAQDTQSDAQQFSSEQQNAQKRRSLFFASREELTEFEKGDRRLDEKFDFKQVRSVILARYQNAVSPYASPSVEYAV